MMSVNVAVYLALEPVDLRGSFDKLAALTRATLKMDPSSGALFLFTNKRRNRMKALWWDKNGWVILYKRLARGSFHWWDPSGTELAHVEISAGDFAQLLAGLPAGKSTSRCPPGLRPVVH